MFQVRQFGTLPVQNQGNNVSRKAGGISWLWLIRNDCGCRLTRLTVTGESRVEKSKLLRYAVLEDRKVFRFEVSNGLALLVFDDHVETHEV